ncbi:serine hydrolase [candidate division KSB1 bacterium]|nr:serine hydrolase [candidate division KSB1 bacterium]
MKKTKKLIIFIIVTIFVIAVLHFGNSAVHMANIGCGYKAKILGSAVFISKRNPENVLNEDLSDPNFKLIKAEIDYEKKTVTTTALFGLVKRKAFYRESLGVTLDLNENDRDISVDKLKNVELSEKYDSTLWPQGDAVQLDNLPTNVNKQKLDEAIECAFLETDSGRLKRTRAIVAVLDGRIIGEKYGQGFSKDVPLLGWSMTKSVTNALVGILVKQNKLALNQKGLFSQWNNSGDQRNDITLNNMMQMSSGLEFGEKYNDLYADVVVMLYKEKSASDFAKNKPLLHNPGTYWSYTSGTTNMIQKIIRNTFEGDDQAYWEFPHKALFNRIGMKSAIIETDASGTFIGSSYMYATARDWARYGLFLLQDGVWEEDRILPEGWVNYSTTPVENAPNGKYGAQFWLNPATLPNYNKELSEKLPQDLYFMWGHESQFVTIIPSRNLVVVRLGLTIKNGAWDQAGFIVKIIEAIG